MRGEEYGLLTLEITVFFLRLAGKGGLGLLCAEELADARVCNVADLVVMLDDLAVLVADTAIACGHEGIAYIVLGADVAVDTGPALVTAALLGVALGAVVVCAATKSTAHCYLISSE